MTTELPKLEFDRKRTRVQYCPCGKSNKDGKFVPYKDYEDKGYCHSCGKTFLPELSKQEFIQYERTKKQPPKLTLIPIPAHYVTESMKPAKNEFLYYIRALVELERAKQVKEEYRIGTHKSGAVIFWYIDETDIARSGHIMQYQKIANPAMYLKANIKRIEGSNNWVHSDSELKIANHLPICLFGQHLLKNSTCDKVAIFEAPKTAVFASLYLPGCICLATGGAGFFKRIIENVPALKGRMVHIYPDLGKYDYWKEKARELRRFGIDYKVSHLLEGKATQEERKAGLDLADYLLRLPPPNPILDIHIKKEAPKYLSHPIIKRMIDKNPLVTTLIEKLSLELITNS